MTCYEKGTIHGSKKQIKIATISVQLACYKCSSTSEYHWTKSKISFMSCLPKHELSDICKCVESFALSYTFPTCMKSEFLSSGLILNVQYVAISIVKGL